MHITTTTITNATNGAIITITKIQRDQSHPVLLAMAVLALLLISSGIYLFLRKKTPRP